jgi:hypothetical protein
LISLLNTPAMGEAAALYVDVKNAPVVQEQGRA